jgi:Tfp pilus assembly protein PilF
MPAVEARDAPHASFTDHYIRVVGEEGEVEPPAVDSAVLDLEPVFSVDATGQAAQVYRGIAYITYGRQRADTSAFEQGIRILSQVLGADTTFSEARYLLGWAQYSMGRPAEAVADLESAVRAEPDIPERLNTLALALEATDGSPTVISRLYRRALTIQPELARVRVNFGRFLQARREYEQAVDQYRRALESEPTLEVAAFNLGTVALELEAPDEAEAWFTQALDLNPLYADALTNLGVVHASRGETDQARDAFERAVEVEPDNRSALGNLGAFYVNHGASQDAIPILRRAVLQDPRYIDALANLALAYFRVEDYASARATAEQATRVDPENALARQVIIAVE